MTRKDFYNMTLNHLRQYAKEHHMPVSKKPKGDGVSYYSYILDTKNKSKQEKVSLITVYNLLQDVVSGDDVQHLVNCNKFHFQSYANHLNSSQIMCINYFMPMVKWDAINDNYVPTEELKRWMVNNIDANFEISSDSTCKFEYVINKEEGTNFDFYIYANHKEYYFEIKYTENGFEGFKAENLTKQENRYENIYKPLLKESIIDDHKVNSAATYRLYYQIMRNIIRVSGPNQYSIFIYPKDNNRCEKQLRTFIDSYVQQNTEQIKILYWDDIVDEGQQKDFYEKYIKREE